LHLGLKFAASSGAVKLNALGARVPATERSRRSRNQLQKIVHTQTKTDGGSTPHLLFFSMPFDNDKFERLVLHVIWRTGDARNFGVTKLNKVLWFADARAFAVLGQSITGETYVREKYGPTARHIDACIAGLSAAGLIEAWTEPFFEFEIRRYTAHQPPDTSIFSSGELSLIDWWIQHIANGQSATQTGEPSPDYAWKIAPIGEELPVAAFLASRVRQPSTQEERGWFENAAERIAAEPIGSK
jgi:hypothetical protein